MPFPEQEIPNYPPQLGPVSPCFAPSFSVSPALSERVAPCIEVFPGMVECLGDHVLFDT